MSELENKLAAPEKLLTTALFGLELHPYQQRMVDMMLSTPEGVKWRLMVGRGRINSMLTKCERNENES